MKIKLILKEFMKYSLLGFVLQCFFLTFLIAEELSAQTYKSVKEVSVSITLDNATVLESFRSIESQTDFLFNFDDIYILNNRARISYRKKRTTVEDVLLKISKEANLRFKQINNTINVSKLSGLQETKKPVIEIKIQNRKVTGKVTSEEDGDGLPGVNVVEKATNNGTVTDIQGNYSIEVSEDATLVFSSVGFTTREVNVGNQSVINITLSPDVAQLEEIVVVGYGTQRKKDLTGSIYSVDREAIEEQGPRVNLAQTLQGLVPGMNITQTGNSADKSAFNILIRGRNSIKANNNPLIVLDGVPYSGGLNEIEQTNIESIEVLTDASATAIYGVRASNGVILITTKKGTRDRRPLLSYNGSYSINKLYDYPDMLGREEFWNYLTERIGGEDVFRSEFPTAARNYDEGNFVNWVEQAQRTGSEQKHALNISGGGEDLNYFISGSYNDVKGIIVNDDFKRAIARANVSVNVTNWLEIGTNTQYMFKELSGVAANVGGSGVWRMNPFMDLYQENGKYAIYPFPEKPVQRNPLTQTYAQDEHTQNRIYSNNYALITVPFIEGLSYKLNTGYTNFNNEHAQYWGNDTYNGLVNEGYALDQHNTNKDILIENILKFRRSFGKHNIDFTGLYSTEKITSEIKSIVSQRFPTDALTWYQHNVAGVIQPNSTYRSQQLVSQMARINYGFDDRYLLTFTVRRDGYSGFGNKNQFGTFPSVAIGWNISNESFFRNVDVVDLLKLRISYGESGNQAIAPYQTLAKLQDLHFLRGESANTTAPGYYPATLANPTLGWEYSNTYNIGFDFAFLSNRLNGSIDVYSARTEDLLLDRAISPVHGITSITQNIGKTKNTGIELNLNSLNIDQTEFTWRTNFNIAHNQNEILELYGTGEDDVGNGWFLGKSIDVNYDLVYDGVWQQGEDNSLQPDAKPGDVKIKDTNGDGKISLDDRDFLGQTNPKYIAGLTNTINYRQFMLSFSIFTNQGVTRRNPLKDTGVNTTATWVPDLGWWSEENPNEDFPANRIEPNPNPYAVQFYEDADYVRLRDVTFSYSLPDQLINNIGLGLSNIKLFFNIQNGLTFTNWEGLDPAFSEQRDYPPERNYLFGLNMDF